MPTYVYECRTCGKVFEADQRITEDALTDCDCGAKGSLRRLIQPVAVAFKGAGFHINDYAPKGSTTDASESKAANASATQPSSSDSNPAEPTPSEAKPVESKPTESKTSDVKTTAPSSSTTPPTKSALE
jgi:putative FmdB family regulatory protein